MANEKIIQMPLTEDYVGKLEAEAELNDRVPSRQAAWIVKRYYDGEAIVLQRIGAGIVVDVDRGKGVAPIGADAGETASVQQQEGAQPVTDCSRLEESGVAS